MCGGGGSAGAGQGPKQPGNKLMLSFGTTRRIAAHCAKALEAAWRMSSDLADLETSLDSQVGATPSIAVVHGKVACGIMGTDTQRDVAIVGLPPPPPLPGSLCKGLFPIRCALAHQCTRALFRIPITWPPFW